MGHRRCILCSDFVTADRSQMKRHVAIVHGDGTFSTLQCDACQKNYYDFEHFLEHTREMSTCSRKRLLITPLSLNENLERAFLSLVDQMMKPVNDDQGPVSSEGTQPTTTPKFTSRDNSTSRSSVVQAQPIARHNKFLPKKSIVGSEAERAGSSESPKIVSVISLAKQNRFIHRSPHDGTYSDGFQQGPESIKQMDLIEESATQAFSGVVAETDKNGDGVKAVLDQETPWMPGGKKNGPESATKSASQSIIEKRIGTEDVQSRMRTSLDLRAHCRQIVRRRYHGGRITCSVCNGSISVMAANRFKISHAMAHLRIHLPEPLLQCELCNYKSNYDWIIRSHLSKQHNTESDQFVNATGNRIEELMEMANRCFDHDSRAGSLKGSNRTSRLQEDRVTDGQNSESNGTVGPQLPLMIVGSNQGGHEAVERRLKPCVNDLRSHCSQIIRRRQRENRVTCSVCRDSIVVIGYGKPKPSQAMAHARCHMTTRRIFQCKLCSHEAHDASAIRKHLANTHQSGSDQYIDTTAGRIQELMDLFSRCFDYDSARVSIRKTKQASGKRLPTRQGNQRYKISQIKQGGYSVPLQKINRGERFGMRPESMSDKPASPSRFHGGDMADKSSRIDRVIQPRPCLAEGKTEIVTNRPARRSRPSSSPHIGEAKSACWEKVKKFMKDGKLECQLCSQKVMVASDTWKERSAVKKDNAYSHVVKHMDIGDLYECSTCHLLTKTKTGMYQHMRKHHGGGEAQLIDHTDRYYREILKQFMACFNLESDGTMHELEATTSKDTEQSTSVAGGDFRADKEKLDQDRCPMPKQVETAQDPKKWLCCDKCVFKSTLKIFPVASKDNALELERSNFFQMHRLTIVMIRDPYSCLGMYLMHVKTFHVRFSCGQKARSMRNFVFGFIIFFLFSLLMV